MSPKFIPPVFRLSLIPGTYWKHPSGCHFKYHQLNKIRSDSSPPLTSTHFSPCLPSLSWRQHHLFSHPTQQPAGSSFLLPGIFHLFAFLSVSWASLLFPNPTIHAMIWHLIISRVIYSSFLSSLLGFSLAQSKPLPLFSQGYVSKMWTNYVRFCQKPFSLLQDCTQAPLPGPQDLLRLHPCLPLKPQLMPHSLSPWPCS